jgi:hypothetical protein
LNGAFVEWLWPLLHIHLYLFLLNHLEGRNKQCGLLRCFCLLIILWRWFYFERGGFDRAVVVVRCVWNTVSVKSARAMWKVLVPCEKCSCFKIVIMISWKGWRSPTSLKSKIHCFLVGGTSSYSFNFLLNLQLKWNALLTEAMLFSFLQMVLHDVTFNVTTTI